MEDICLEKFIDPVKYKKDESLNPLDLQGEIIKQAALYGYYAECAVRAQRQADKFKFLMEITEANVDKGIRDAGAAAGRKMTEAQIEKEILRNKSYIKAVNLYHDAKEIAGICQSAADAIKMKKDALYNLTSQYKEELKGDMRIMDQEQRQARAERARRVLGVTEDE